MNETIIVYFRKEIKEGGEILRGKILKFKPKIAVFNGKGKLVSDRVSYECVYCPMMNS